MKKIKIFILIIINIYLLTNCHCKHCIDNLSTENDKIPYADSSLVAFENDTLGIIYDSVFVKLGDPSASYGCNGGGDDDNDKCGASSVLYYSNFFYVEISQGSNFYQNEIAYFSKNIYSSFPEKVSFIYKNKTINVFHINFETDTVGSVIWQNNVNFDSTFVYNDYYFTVDSTIKLLQYTTVYRDGTRRVWRLKE